VSFFSKRDSATAAGPDPGRTPRYSSGWSQLHKFLKSQEGLRILDIGPTSSTNINYLTGLGHSIYMANLVEEANRPEWISQDEGGEPVFDVDAFLAQNLSFSGRTFDIVTLWDVPDFLPPAILPGIVRRLYEVMAPGGQILAFFHSAATGPMTEFSRYHLTDSDQVEMQRFGTHPIRQAFTNRQIETLFKDFSSYRFFLAKDALREVIVTR
jgi:hypothetical protein